MFQAPPPAGSPAILANGDGVVCTSLCKCGHIGATPALRSFPGASYPRHSLPQFTPIRTPDLQEGKDDVATGSCGEGSVGALN